MQCVSLGLAIETRKPCGDTVDVSIFGSLWGKFALLWHSLIGPVTSDVGLRGSALLMSKQAHTNLYEES